MIKILMTVVAIISLQLGYVPTALWDLAPKVFPACQSEDSDWCYWDADERGNRIGESFIVINGQVLIFDNGE